MYVALSLVVVTVVALASLYAKWRRVKSYWAKRGVPHSPPHPVMGSLTFLQKKNPGVWMRELYEQFKSPYVGIWLFWRPALVVNSPEIARRVLVKDFDVFRNRFLGSGSGEVDPVGGLNIFTVHDPLWSSIRRRLTPVFTSAKLKSLHTLYSTKSKELVKRIGNDLVKNVPIELRTLYADYTTDIIGISAFGVNSDATLTGEGPMRTITNDFMRYSFMRSIAWGSIFFLPELVKVFRFSFFPKKSVDFLRKVFKQIVNQRGGYSDKAEVNDLLDALRKIKYEADQNNEEMDEDLIIAQAAIFLQGGFDTSAVALTYATYELAYYPDVQQRARKELIVAKEKIGNKDFDETVFKELAYFKGVVKETLRKYSAMGWLDRICDRDYKIDEKLTIPAGTAVYVNGNGMHYDPEFYPDPYEFKPERFLDEEKNSSRPFLPFGDGPRACIGLQFAYRTIWYALAEILLKYDLRPYPGSKKPVDCDVEKKGLFFMPGEPLHVRFIPRY